MRNHLNLNFISAVNSHWLLLAIIVLTTVSACAPRLSRAPFDPRRCMEHVPARVEGLTVLDGSRSPASIIRDMVPVVCNGQVLFDRMQTTDADLNAGTVVFRVEVEYTGEVVAVTAEDATIQSAAFIREVSDFIMDTDFIAWTRDDVDTVFIYPARFGD